MFNSEDRTLSIESHVSTGADRGQRVTPLDLRQSKFSTALRGFDRAEVSAFLLDAAEGYDHAMRENERLRQEVARLEASVNQFRQIEGSLTNTLMTAQKATDDMRESAVQEAGRVLREAQQAATDTRESSTQEAARIIKDAEDRAELLIQRAQARVEEVGREIDGLKLKRREAEAGIEATISALHSTLDFVRDRDRREREEHVVPLRSLVEVARPA
ncbi:MAG: DivIVA domain-containing protein [Vicinamibacterales bacterium]